MKKVIGYIRVSTEYQKLKENSINNQIKSINEYCNRNDFDLVEIFEDNGISGLISNRIGLTEMIDKIKSENIDCVIVYKLTSLLKSIKFIRQSYISLFLFKSSYPSIPAKNIFFTFVCFKICNIQLKTIGEGISQYFKFDLKTPLDIFNP